MTNLAQNDSTPDSFSVTWDFDPTTSEATGFTVEHSLDDGKAGAGR